VRWGGTSWSILEVAELSIPASYWQETRLGAVSCLYVADCTAVGLSISAPEGALGQHTAWAEQSVVKLAKATTEAAGGVKATQATLNGTVNPEGTGASYYFEYGTSSSYGSKAPLTAEEAGWGSSDVAVGRVVTGLSPDTTYHFRVVAETAAGTTKGADQTFTTLKVPRATTEPASNVKSNQATLNGTVNPEGTATSYYFEYGTSKSYGGKAPAVAEGVGSGVVNIAVSNVITGLTMGSTYHFRVVAENAAGEIVNGKDETFFAPKAPLVTSEPASYTGTLEPLLNGVVDPQGAATSYYFEFGPTQAYGSKAPVPSKGIGADPVPHQVSAALGPLESNTTYHYRAVASNEIGTTMGADRSFTTPPACKGSGAGCEWTTQSTVSPERTELQLKDVSCVTAATCMAVGYDSYAEKTFAEAWNGSEWKVIRSSLGGTSPTVSCAGLTSCLVVGAGGGTQGTWQLFQLGEGNAWNSTFYAFDPPSGATAWALKDISCSSESACTAVGYSYSSETGKYKTLVERFNGTSWSIQASAEPGEGSAQLAMTSVSCPVSAFCMATGKAGGKPFAESWNGTQWSASSVSGPQGGRFDGVSCASSTYCMAVGRIDGGWTGWAGDETLAASWNGSAWTTTEAPPPTEELPVTGAALSSVSCLSPSACVAAGSYFTDEGEEGDEERTLSEAWNGSEWTVQVSTSPDTISALSGISCTSTTRCTAVGGARPVYTDTNNMVTLGERWE
jgi:hypothetical protein